MGFYGNMWLENYDNIFLNETYLFEDLCLEANNGANFIDKICHVIHNFIEFLKRKIKVFKEFIIKKFNIRKKKIDDIKKEDEYIKSEEKFKKAEEKENDDNFEPFTVTYYEIYDNYLSKLSLVRNLLTNTSWRTSDLISSGKTTGKSEYEKDLEDFDNLTDYFNAYDFEKCKEDITISSKKELESFCNKLFNDQKKLDKVLDPPDKNIAILIADDIITVTTELEKSLIKQIPNIENEDTRELSSIISKLIHSLGNLSSSCTKFINKLTDVSSKNAILNNELMCKKYI